MPQSRTGESRQERIGAEDILPAGFRARMEAELGTEYPLFLASYERPRRLSLRLNPLKQTDAGAGVLYCADERIPWEETGRYCPPEARPGRSALHEAGAFYIQEASAMLPAAIADPMPGEYVLDLCAAPGGKSTQIAGRLRGEGLLVSNEIHPARARVLSANMERMGVRNAVVTGEDPVRLSPRFPGFFDLVMVDAPCSGEGMFRKEPQASADWSPETVAMCAERQRGILEEAAVMTAPGGRIVYSTCTFARQENEETVLYFLKKHPDFRLETPELLRRGCPGLSEGLPTGEEEDRELCRRMVRIWPHRAEGEGHFAALLVRDGERKERGNAAGQGALGRGNRRRTAGRGGDTARKQEALQLWEEFARSALSKDCALLTACRQCPDHVILFGEELYLLPAGMRLDGLRVLRPGLHLGTVRRGRFVPAHALAMALRPEEAAGVLRIDPDSAASAAWLRGESMAAGDPFKGWILVCAGNCSLGWGRSDGRIVKNHYPKGLRV